MLVAEVRRLECLVGVILFAGVEVVTLDLYVDVFVLLPCWVEWRCRVGVLVLSGPLLPLWRRRELGDLALELLVAGVLIQFDYR